MLRSVRHRLEYVLFRGLATPLRGLPHGAARPLGRALGELFFLLDVHRRRVAVANLGRAFPGWSQAQRRRTARRCCRHFGAMVADTISFQRFDAVELCRRLTLHGWRHLDEAEAASAERGAGGVLVLSAHLGNWEMAAHPVALYRGPFHVVARPFNNPLVWRHMRRARERFGQRFISKRGAARPVVRALRRGAKVGLVIDQRVRPPDAMTVPFFGEPALTTPLPARLALRYRVPAVAIFGYPKEGGGYDVVLRPPILPPESDSDADDAVERLTRRYLAVIEDEIRTRPEQWLWFHRRWRR